MVNTRFEFSSSNYCFTVIYQTINVMRDDVIEMLKENITEIATQTNFALSHVNQEINSGNDESELAEIKARINSIKEESDALYRIIAAIPAQ